MKRVVCICTLALFLVGTGPVDAALVVETYGGTALTHDTDTDLYWYWDLSLFADQTYQTQLNNIALLDLSGHGFAPFRMATQEDMESLWLYDAPEIIDRFHWSAANSDYEYYYGRYDRVAPGVRPPNEKSHYYAFAYYYLPDEEKRKRYLTYQWIYDNDTNELIGAMAVTTAVPIPSTILLLTAGLFALIGMTRKKFKNSIMPN